MLARKIGADLRAVGETDDDGGEPSRRERLAELTMASRMLGQRSDTVLLFDEMEDLFGAGGLSLQPRDAVEGPFQPDPRNQPDPGDLDHELGPNV